MQDAFFNPALWVPIAAFVVALAVAIYGNNRTNGRLRTIGLALVAVVAAWCGVAYLVQTPLEKCITRTHDIIAATEAADWPKLRTLLDDRTTVAIGRWSVSGKEDIAAKTEASATAYALKNIRILNTETAAGPGTVDVSFRALLEGAGTIPSDWRFEYETRPEGITLTRIVPVSVGTFSGEQLQQRVR